ncbi:MULTISPECIES: ring-cleaving dioxygenase [unclassified Actinopolyspora]|uniref:ring-cleaving dioxygenase n=1 Tax=unclassified Actinopolyspora TaxID=2639451 RepID=UPI0013F6795E|nr:MULTISPECIES: ring-cleaving dioxygenase [unclassified Actinopolyspora]NHD15567.1 ring-cleaving dioxygenase [Actinopolyspora sp. BKK2]NHE75220.1 ring-cleaving dioxygenase [Actinopolyspora sp. BKK1]
MPSTPTGLHHVTAIATDPQRNADFYRTALGLRLVKRTVNFDAPDTYHLYFGGESGQPGTLITFFPWPGAPSGRRGAGQTTAVAFSVPQNSLGWWYRHLDGLEVNVGTPATRSSEEALRVADPDGLLIELVGHPMADQRGPWEEGTIPPEYAIRGLHSVTVTEIGHEHTAELLTDTLGFRLVEESGSRFRFAAGSEGSGALVDVLCSPEAPLGTVAAGTVHHIAWRTPDESEQVDWRNTLLDRGLDITPVLDRRYFHSIYFREPGGVLFEIATDSPGFTVDEPLMELGRALKLPPWLEPSRAEIEQSLPALRVPGPEEEITFTPPPTGEPS